MKFTDSTEQDIEQLSEWIKNDPYHKDCLNPRWWLTGNGFQSFCLQDNKGPTMYVRLDKENELIRIHIQFAPEEEVSKIRIIKSIMRALPVVKNYIRELGFKGFVYKSTNQSLINFLRIKFDFTPVGKNDDYWMPFEE